MVAKRWFEVPLTREERELLGDLNGKQHTWSMYRQHQRWPGGRTVPAPEPFTEIEIEQWNALMPRWHEMQRIKEAKKRRREFLLMPVTIPMIVVGAAFAAGGALLTIASNVLASAIDWVDEHIVRR